MTSSKDRKKQEEERQVFRRFARVCPLDIRDTSIESRCPREPDILCEVLGERQVAFELTRLEAEEYRAAQAGQERTLDKSIAFKKEIVKCPQLVQRYRGAHIALDDTKLNVEDIITLIETAPHDREWLFLIENGIQLEHSDGNYAPMLVVDCVEILFAISKHIQVKIQKVANEIIKSHHPIEILAHFDSPWAENRNWQHESEQLQDCFAELLTTSQVRRIWIYDPRADVVRFVYSPFERDG